ncbi:hypothetical protein [Bacillus sp. ISL-34]
MRPHSKHEKQQGHHGHARDEATSQIFTNINGTIILDK